MKMTIQEIGKQLEIEDEAVVRGVVKYLEATGAVVAVGVRPSQTGKGKGATLYEATGDGTGAYGRLELLLKVMS